MFERKLLTMLAETPVHAGSGAELGAVDLPVQRERHTRYPTIHGSGVKGVLRDLCEEKNGGSNSAITTVLFGSPPPEGPGGDALEAGSLVVGDARLLLLPVRSVGNVFAWLTCPYLLRRLERDLAGVEGGAGLAAKLRVPSPGEEALVSSKFPLDGAAMIEEIEVPARKGDAAEKVAEVLRDLLPGGEEMQYWHDLLPRNLVILGDELFADVALHATEVVTRVRLTDEKTVQTGALWTEEYVPADTVFYSVLALQQARLGRMWEKKGNGGPGGADGWEWVKDLIQDNPVAQFGGKETIGRGFLRLRLWP